jgi:hypothetical protein
VKKEKDKYRMVGTFTRHINEFRANLKKSFTDMNKAINVRFDTLTLDVLEYVRDHGCRVLHLSSDVFLDDYLCIEGENGEIKYLHVNDLKDLLKPKT